MLEAMSVSYLQQFVKMCVEVTGCNPEWLYDECKKSIRSLRGTKTARCQDALEARWYDSLKNGNPDYGVYDSIDIVPDLWACWVVYSREYLRSIASPKALPNGSIVDDIGHAECIVDLGCGIGYSTAALKQLFPKSIVIGTNLPHTAQFKICEKVSTLYGFSVADGLIERADLVFASEYFEHFERPIEHLEEVITKLKPTRVLTANSFNAVSLGHFSVYRHSSLMLQGRATSRLFRKAMNAYGYKKVPTRCWNDRPTYWVKT